MLGGVDRSRGICSGVSSLEVSRYGSECPGSIFGSLGGDGPGPGFVGWARRSLGVGFRGTCGIVVLFVGFVSSPFHFSRICWPDRLALVGGGFSWSGLKARIEMEMSTGVGC